MPPLDIDRVILRGPARLAGSHTRQLVDDLSLGNALGWSMSHSGSKFTPGSEWSFEVRDEDAIELSQACGESSERLHRSGAP